MAPPISMRKCWQKWTRLKMLPFVSRKIVHSGWNQTTTRKMLLDASQTVGIVYSWKGEKEWMFLTNTIPVSVRVCHHHLVAQKFVSPILMSGWCVCTRVCMCAAHLLASGSSISFYHLVFNRMSCRIDVSVIPRRPQSRSLPHHRSFPLVTQ
jgi:hypothetical protein